MCCTRDMSEEVLDLPSIDTLFRQSIGKGLRVQLEFRRLRPIILDLLKLSTSLPLDLGGHHDIDKRQETRVS